MREYSIGIRRKGFTLIEVLIALGIFSLMSVGAFQLLSSSVNYQQRSEQRVSDFKSVNKMLNLMERDLLQAVDRPVRDDYGDRLEAFVGDSKSIEFTRGGWANRPDLMAAVGQPAHATLQRMAYRFDFADDGRGGYQNLWARSRWDVLDRVPSSQPQTDLNMVFERVVVRYLSHQKVWSNHWPLSSDAVDGEDYSVLPLAVEIEFTLPGFGEVRRLFQVSSSASNNQGVVAQ